MLICLCCDWRGVVVFHHALHNNNNNKRQRWPILVCSPKPHTPPSTPPPSPAAAHTLPVSRTPFARPALPTIHTPSSITPHTPPLHRSTIVLHQSTINNHHCSLPPPSCSACKYTEERTNGDKTEVAEVDYEDVTAKHVHKTWSIDCPEPDESSSSSSTSTSSLSDSSFDVSSINGGVRNTISIIAVLLAALLM